MKAKKREANMRTFMLCAIVAGMLAGATPAMAQSCAKPVDRSFKIFNALMYDQQPDLAQFGLRPIHIVDRGIWKSGASRKSAPDPALVRKYLKSLPDDDTPLVLDFEDFNLLGSARSARSEVNGVMRILGEFRKYSGDRPLGFYGYVPNRDYWRAIEPQQSQKFRAWQADNNNSKAIARSVDIVFPSIYTFYPDQKNWAKYARAQICEARRLSSQPVYVFLWPNYHDEKSGPKLIPADYWRLQLETARSLADGVVIWGGWDFEKRGRQRWNAKAPWWLITKRFAQTVASSKSRSERD